MIEIGKRDVTGYGQLAMSSFEANRTFSCVDANELMKDPRKTARIMKEIVNLYENGHIHPIRPIKSFDVAEVEDAYRYMQQGHHVGKIVIKFPQHDELPLALIAPEPSFKSDASYLLVGGTGGLGKAIASWMVSLISGTFHPILFYILIVEIYHFINNYTNSQKCRYLMAPEVSFSYLGLLESL